MKLNFIKKFWIINKNTSSDNPFINSGYAPNKDSVIGCQICWTFGHAYTWGIVYSFWTMNQCKPNEAHAYTSISESGPRPWTLPDIWRIQFGCTCLLFTIPPCFLPFLHPVLHSHIYTHTLPYLSSQEHSYSLLVIFFEHGITFDDSGETDYHHPTN